MKTKELLGISLFILISLIIYGFFPVKGVFQQIIITLIFFVVLPIVFNRFFLKKDIIFSCFGVGDWKNGLLFGFFSIIIVGVIFFVLCNYFEFLINYTIPIIIVKSFKKFILYEFFLVLPIIIIYEFYFRNFIMLTFKPVLQYWAILLQALVFLVLVLSIGGGSIYLFLPYLIFAPLAGVITYKSSSSIYSIATQFIVILTINIVVIKMIN